MLLVRFWPDAPSSVLESVGSSTVKTAVWPLGLTLAVDTAASSVMILNVKSGASQASEILPCCAASVNGQENLCNLRWWWSSDVTWNTH